MEQQMPNWLKKRAELTPERTALIFENKSYTFLQLYQSASKAAGQLAFAGISSGEVAAVLLPNHSDSVMILYALQMMGVRTVILNNRLTAKELAWQLEDSDAAALISEESFEEKLSQIKKESTIKILPKEKIFQFPVADFQLLEEYHLDEVTTVMYTSGTTGSPKGVLQTYGNHWWSAAASALNIGLQENDKWLCAVPIFHISGYSILMRSLVYGMCVVLYRNFNERIILEGIEQHRVTIMSAVSTMLLRLTDALGETRLPEFFRCLLLGGGPAPLSLLETCKQKGIPVYQTYGMTETSSQFATLAPEYSLEKLGSAGKALFPNQIKIISELGIEVPAQSEGEIIVKGPNVTPGYLHREDETKEKIKKGWLHTGDLGYLDKDGFLYVLDRRTDLIISGGENIYPAEIEGVLLGHKAVEDAGVIGVADPEWGHVPLAFVVRRAGAAIDESSLISYCTDSLAKYKVPKGIVFSESLPRNASKKLLRRKLRDWAAGQGETHEPSKD
ncbi:o-succinylbenzoate--CoA ligase [Mesobacillus foraminis]|uniref:o-succinylbenzoate--CoA ligase n=1 Tax=Mesobacillus foraminis TaxID=279826 RepID=UPI0039A1BF34